MEYKEYEAKQMNEKDNFIDEAIGSLRREFDDKIGDLTYKNNC